MNDLRLFIPSDEMAVMAAMRLFSSPERLFFGGRGGSAYERVKPPHDKWRCQNQNRRLARLKVTVCSGRSLAAAEA